MTTTVVEKVKSPWQWGQEMYTYDPGAVETLLHS